jgi:glycyl-tRNA synthetase alpha chain
VSVTERASYLGRLRALARQIAEAYVRQREELGYPLLKPIEARRAAGVPA